MLRESFQQKRELKARDIKGDLVVIGGGMSGICCAITAARAGIRVVLIHDRPVLGGNASSEVRLWVQGATTHMSNNNRWAREGGVINEILVENHFRNSDGNSIIFDTILLEKVLAETNITLLLNTSVYELKKDGEDKIKSLKAFCGQNATFYKIDASFYCDSSGDGIVAYLSGASFRMGAEPKEEFDEDFAPDASFGELPGHSIYFYTRKTSKPTTFVAPAFANKNIDKIPRFKSFDINEKGFKLWWIEYGGRLDAVQDTETIKWELWKIVFGVWDYIKNSGKYPEAECLTLDWVGSISGKMESRRFEGLYMLNQHDIINQTNFPDAVSYGGWPIDLHPSDGIYSNSPKYCQWHSAGLYQIPYRSLVSKDIKNLFLAGRIISATHVASSSIRVMGTCSQNAQVVGMAAALCKKNNAMPHDFVGGPNLKRLQKELVKTGQYIPGLQLGDTLDLCANCDITASSSLALAELPADGPWLKLDRSVIQMIPFDKGSSPSFTVTVKAAKKCELEVQLRQSEKALNFTPEITLEVQSVELEAGETEVSVNFMTTLTKTGYIYICFAKNEDVEVRCSNQRVTGLLTLFGQEKNETQGGLIKSDRIGDFEFWSPKRRPAGQNLAFEIKPALKVFAAGEMRNGITRPAIMPNAWVADLKDKQPELHLKWEEPQTIRKIRMAFDTDFDHPMESVLVSHPANISPFVIRNYQILNDREEIIYEKKGNYQTRNILNFMDSPLVTKEITIRFEHPSENIPAAVFEIRCYEN
ncbi:FAD-dependent oxidoreductase [Flammeovirgaceae bacterium SG7u.111]|nr:FAD-dependent oxidoreductase [Flammeovirgaceae bacterium SG7u.132]WPO37012.1 FAD-dependent oxidoreductase [Flammeovirgaceae bacterium SG7u.111]